jgi:FkbM family methyltransferase
LVKGAHRGDPNNRIDSVITRGWVLPRPVTKAMPTLQRALHIGSRVRGMAAFASEGLTTADKLKMLVIGYARGHTFGPCDIVSRFGQRLFPKIAVRPRLLGGLTLHLDPSNLSHLITADEILIQQVYDLRLVPFTPDSILDCGANIGMFTLQAASTFPQSKLIAFEPDPENAQWLKEQVEANKLSVDVVEAAVSTSDGEAVFEAGLGCGSAFGDASSPSSRAISVQTLDLAGYISKIQCRRLLLKLDVEGAEEELLPKIVSVLPRNSFLFFETHGGTKSWARSTRLLQEHGFAVKARRQRQIYTDGIAARVN